MIATTEARPVRIVSDTGRPFAACTNLPVRQELLSQEAMVEIAGGTRVELPNFNSSSVVILPMASASTVKEVIKGVTIYVASQTIWANRNQIYNGACYVADKVGDAFSTAYQDVSGGVRTIWNWATH